MVVSLGSLARGVLCEKGLNDLLEVVERARWQGVEPIRCRTLQAGSKGEAHDWVIPVANHHFVSEVPDVLNWIARSRVAVEGASLEFSQKFPPGSLERGELWRRGKWDQVLRQLGHDSFLDQFIEGMEISGPPALRIALCLRGVILEGCDLGLELLVE